jgi:hypothetical protein
MLNSNLAAGLSGTAAQVSLNCSCVQGPHREVHRAAFADAQPRGVQERVVVGEPPPPTVELRTVPRYTEYRYAVVNDQRVIVDPRTRRVIRIID